MQLLINKYSLICKYFTLLAWEGINNALTKASWRWHVSTLPKVTSKSTTLSNRRVHLNAQFSAEFSMIKSNDTSSWWLPVSPVTILGGVCLWFAAPLLLVAVVLRSRRLRSIVSAISIRATPWLPRYVLLFSGGDRFYGLRFWWRRFGFRSLEVALGLGAGFGFWFGGTLRLVWSEGS
jgi:hypothetical protein